MRMMKKTRRVMRRARKRARILRTTASMVKIPGVQGLPEVASDIPCWRRAAMISEGKYYCAHKHCLLGKCLLLYVITLAFVFICRSILLNKLLKVGWCVFQDMYKVAKKFVSYRLCIILLTVL